MVLGLNLNQHPTRQEPFLLYYFSSLLSDTYSSLVWGLHHAMLRDYSQICTENLLLGLAGHMGYWGFNQDGLCKALLAVLPLLA